MYVEDINNLFEYISENKEWIFSGVGVTALAFVGTYILKVSKKKEVPVNVFDLEKAPKKSILSLYSLAPNFILRWRFKELRINQLVKIDTRPRGESIHLNLGELPNCTVWVQIINHTPFYLDIENIKGELNYKGCGISIETKDHVGTARHTSNDGVLLEGVLTGEQANHCSKDDDDSYNSLSLRARIRTRFGVFKKYSGDLQCLHIHIVNKRKLQA